MLDCGMELEVKRPNFITQGVSRRGDGIGDYVI